MEPVQIKPPPVTKIILESARAIKFYSKIEQEQVGVKQRWLVKSEQLPGTGKPWTCSVFFGSIGVWAEE